MNQFYLRKRKFSFLLLSVSILFFSFIGINEIQDSFSSLCKNADAYYLHSYTDVTYQKNWAKYKKYISIDYKLVVNNTSGVENYAFLNLSEYESNHIKQIDVKTLKADGTSVKLDSSLVFKKKGKKKKFGAINYPIPAVEPGDTIAVSYVYYEFVRKTNLSSYVSLHNSLPSKNSQYTIQAPPSVKIRYKPYNGFTEPKVIANDSILYLSFSMDKLKGYKENKYSCFSCELPYLYYALENKENKLRTWQHVYNEEFNTLTQPLNLDYHRASYYKRWKRRVIGEAKDSSKYYKFNLLYNEVLNNFEITPIVPNELIKSSGYFLKEKKFDPFSIRRFYRQILEDLDINYWAVFAKSKRAGNIDPTYIRKGEFDHIFFAMENENGNLNLLYPHSENLKYRIDEIPTSIYNTKAILVKRKSNLKKTKKEKFISRDFKLAKEDSVSTGQIILPGMNPTHNKVSQRVYSKVNKTNNKTSFKSQLRISGGLSTELRDFFSMMSKDKEASNYYNALSEFEGDYKALEIDSVINTRLSPKKPFSFIINSSGEVKNAVTHINDSLVSLSLDKLINHNQVETPLENSDLNYYLDYTFSDDMIFHLDFDSKIEVLGIKNGNIEFKNDYGEYVFQISKNKANQLKFKSLYKIKKNVILKENYSELKQLNNEVRKAKNKRFVIKLKS